MKIAGFQKTSLIDYPGKIVSIIFTQGCNLKCPYCHNPQLIPPDNEHKSYFAIDEILAFLEQRKGLIDGVSITGGEPTSQPDLVDFIKEIKLRDLEVKLDTNGTNPEMLRKLLAGNQLDYIAMDIKAPLEKYSQFKGNEQLIINLEDSINLIKEFSSIQPNLSYEFRTTILPGLHTIDDIKKIGQLINGASQFYLQNFRPVNTLDPELTKIHGFPPAELELFQKAISPFVSKVEIRD